MSDVRRERLSKTRRRPGLGGRAASWALETLAVSPMAPRLLAAARRLRRGRAFLVLTYHRVGGPEDPFFTGISVESFERQMSYLRRSWNVLPVTELVARAEAGTLPPLAVGITFDDNYRSVHDLALPVLCRLGLPAMVFAPTGPLIDGGTLWYDRVLHAFKHRTRTTLGEDEVPGVGEIVLEDLESAVLGADRVLERLRRLEDGERMEAVERIQARLRPDPPALAPVHRTASLQELRDGLAHGLEVGSHTVTHPILAGLDPERLQREVVDSRRQLEDWLQRPIELFAYPNGGAEDFDVGCEEALRKAGYRAAFCTRPGINGPNWRQDRFRVLRNDGTDTPPRRLMLRLAALELAA